MKFHSPHFLPFPLTGGRGWGLGVVFLLSCAPPGPRPYYSRHSGHYITPKSQDYTTSPLRGEGGGNEKKMPGGTTPLPPHRGKGSGIRGVAESYLGTPYRFGGQSRSGIDCSGFVQKVFRDALQIQLPRNSAAMSRHGKAVSKGSLKPGDLVFFKGFLFIDHVGIYMGDGYFIHSQSGIGVTYTRLDAPYFGAHYAGAKRVLD